MKASFPPWLKKESHVQLDFINSRTKESGEKDLIRLLTDLLFVHIREHWARSAFHKEQGLLEILTQDSIHHPPSVFCFKKVHLVHLRRVMYNVALNWTKSCTIIIQLYLSSLDKEQPYFKLVGPYISPIHILYSEMTATVTTYKCCPFCKIFFYFCQYSQGA